MAAHAGDRTRTALIRAAERQMAEHGIEGAELLVVVRLAGQRNRSAVIYHFGGRDGLVEAILRKHRARINEDRNRMLDELEAAGRAPTVRNVVEALVWPLAASLRTPSGRDYAVILAERASARLGGSRRGPRDPRRQPRAREPDAVRDGRG